MRHLLLCTLLAGAFTAEASPDFGPTLDWGEVVAALRTHAPELRAARAEADAVQAAIPQASAWEDPRLMLELAPASLDADEPGWGVAVSQVLPWPAQITARKNRSLALADAALARSASQERGLLAEARAAYAEYWLQGQRLKLYDEELTLIDGLLQAAQAQVAAGLASSSMSAEAQAMRAEVERMRLMAVREQRTQGSGMLARMLGLDAQACLPPPPDHLPGPRPLPPVAELLQRARQGPLVQVAESGLTTAQAERRLAALEGRPGFALSAGWTTMEEDEDMRATVGVEIMLPIQRATRRAGQNTAEAELLAASAEAHRAAVHAEQTTLDILARLDENRAAIALTSEHELPALATAATFARSAYAAGTLMLTEVLAVERRRLAAAQRLAFDQHEYFHWLGELAALTGPDGLALETEDAP